MSILIVLINLCVILLLMDYVNFARGMTHGIYTNRKRDEGERQQRNK
jgi:hypothetical protein